VHITGGPPGSPPMIFKGGDGGSVVIENIARENSTPAPASDPKRATIEARMYDLISKDVSTHTWTVRQFAEALGCSEGAVHKTKTWKSLNTSREMARQARAVEAYHRNLDRSSRVHK
jgi:hypothetical protein